jgi:hypothetical protein
MCASSLKQFNLNPKRGIIMESLAERLVRLHQEQLNAAKLRK